MRGTSLEDDTGRRWPVGKLELFFFFFSLRTCCAGSHQGPPRDKQRPEKGAKKNITLCYISPPFLFFFFKIRIAIISLLLCPR